VIGALLVGVVCSIVACCVFDAIPKWSLLVARLATRLVPCPLKEMVDPSADAHDIWAEVQAGTATRVELVTMSIRALLVGAPQLLVLDLYVRREANAVVRAAEKAIKDGAAHGSGAPASRREGSASGYRPQQIPAGASTRKPFNGVMPPSLEGYAGSLPGPLPEDGALLDEYGGYTDRYGYYHPNSYPPIGYTDRYGNYYLSPDYE
jgi:hypothetical protein